MAIGMGIGMGNFPFTSQEAFWRWVALCESSRLDSIWQSDRLVSTESFMEPMSMMAALAGATQRIKFGMNSVVLGFRNPVLLAKQCATIDYLSGGRLLPSFGIGAREAPEWQAAGLDASQRGKRANESLEIMTRLWREDLVDYQGEHFRLNKASVNPKPQQQSLPVWIGGASTAAVHRTARYGSGWLAGLQGPDKTSETIAAIKMALIREKRHIADDHYGATIVYRYQNKASTTQHPLLENQQARQISAIGNSKDIMTLIHAYIAAGVSKFIAIPLAESDQDMIDQTQLLVKEVLPAIEALNK